MGADSLSARFLQGDGESRTSCPRPGKHLAPPAEANPRAARPEPDSSRPAAEYPEDFA